MHAAFVERDITPPVGTWQDGFAGRRRPSERVLDPLFLRCMALEDARGERAVVVGADILTWPKDITFRTKLWAERALQLPSSALWMTGALNHFGPVLSQKAATPHWTVDLDYARHVEAALREAIRTALDSLAPCRARFGVMEIPVGIARHAPDGRGGYLPGFQAYEEGYCDPYTPVLAVYDTHGRRLRGLWYTISSHPTCLTGPNEMYAITADYPGAVAQGLKARLSGDLCPLFSQGASGDLKSRFYDRTTGRFRAATPDEVEAMGGGIAAKIAQFLDSDGMQDLPFHLAHAETPFDVPFQMDTVPTLDELLALADPSRPLEERNRHEAAWPAKMIEWMRTGSMPRAFTFHASRLWLNDDIQAVGLTGGVTSGVGRMLRETFGLNRTIVAGQCSYGGTYVPSSAMVRGRAPEAWDSIRYAGFPAPYVETIDDLILEAMRRLDAPIRKAGR